MAIPIAYNFRNLVVRKTTTIMTALGIALTVAVVLAIMSMVQGLRTALTSTAEQLHVGTGDWEVVGVMSSGQSATTSEIFADLNQLSSDQHRTAVLSSALVQASDPVAADVLVKGISNDQQMNMDAEPESAYYAAQ